LPPGAEGPQIFGQPPGAGGGGGGGGGAQNSAGVKSPNHAIPLRRYYEVTDELRRIPVALVLTVDEHRINDVLAAFASSRIRFRTTMSPWNRVPPLQRPDFLRPHAAPAGGNNPGVRPPPMGGGLPGPMGGGGARPMPSGGGGTGPAGGGGGSGGPALGPLPGDEEVPQVELQIYGLVTLYESPDAVMRIDQERKNAPAPAGP
jgi:hypothetical protein